MTFYITDLHNQLLNDISNNDIIVCHLTRESPVIKKLIELTNFSLYRVNVPQQLDGFVSLGDIIIENDLNDISVLLIKSSYVSLKYSTDYKIIAKTTKGYIWEPINENIDYKPIGLIYSQSKPLFNTPLLHKSILMESQQTIMGIGKLNDYNLLGGPKQRKITIDISTINNEPINDDKTETLNNWTPIEGQNVILLAPDNPWFIDRPVLKPINNIPTVRNTETVEQVENDHCTYIDYFRTSLMIATIIMMVYHISVYLHAKFSKTSSISS